MTEDDLYELKVEVVRLSALNSILEKKVESLTEQLSVTGLTIDELQGIHELIQGQISLIASLQLKSDVSNATSAINSLCKLVSLVSKPTD